jgi:hypothetical protein
MQHSSQMIDLVLQDLRLPDEGMNCFRFCKFVQVPDCDRPNPWKQPLNIERH